MPQRQIAHRVNPSAQAAPVLRFIPKFQNGIWCVFDKHWFRPVAGPFESRKHVLEDMKEKGVYSTTLELQ